MGDPTDPFFELAYLSHVEVLTGKFGFPARVYGSKSSALKCAHGGMKSANRFHHRGTPPVSEEG